MKRWRLLRIFSQLLFLVVFLWLFFQTRVDCPEPTSGWLNLFFRADPLIALAAMGGGQCVLWGLWPAALLLVFSLFFGKVFCGWVCPLGTLLDGVHRLFRPWLKRLPFFDAPSLNNRSMRSLRVGILVVLLLSAVGGFQAFLFLDPLTLLFRALTLFGDPFLFDQSLAFFTWLYHHAPAGVNAIGDVVYDGLKSSVLPLERPTRLLGAMALGMLLFVFLLEVVARRFWCRFLCPLGALLGCVSRYSVFKRVPGKSGCADCGGCAPNCRMGAFDEKSKWLAESCNMCMDCTGNCPKNRVSFRLKKNTYLEVVPVDVSKRFFLASLVTGVAVPLLARTTGLAKAASPADCQAGLLRPPGALAGDDFWDRCVRCGECMKVCPTSALQPAWTEAGYEGVWSPRLIPRLGYCEYNCNACGEVCPTGAIARLPLEEKQVAVIGKARFDKSRCIPYATGESCMVCEEHCPVPNKAIRYKEVEMETASGKQTVVRQPYVKHGRCIGCGICEKVCPLEGESAIRVYPVSAFAHKE